MGFSLCCRRSARMQVTRAQESNVSLRACVCVYVRDFQLARTELNYSCPNKIKLVPHKLYKIFLISSLDFDSSGVLPSAWTLVALRESWVFFTWYMEYFAQKCANSSLSVDRSVSWPSRIQCYQPACSVTTI